MAKAATGRFAPAVRAIREQISTGELPPGQWLPSVAQLMTQYGITRYSATEAIKKLASEGLIDIVDGKGSYVRTRRDHATHADTRAIHDTPHGYRDAETPHWRPAEPPSTYRINATMDLALALAVPEHSALFVHDRLLQHTEHHDRPATTPPRRMTHRLYLPMSTCLRVPALADDPFRTPDELYEALTTAGLHIAFTEHVRATTPTPNDTTSLHMTPGAIVLITRRLLTDSTTHTTLAMEETRRSAEDTQLTYPLTPTHQPTPQPTGHNRTDGNVNP